MAEQHDEQHAQHIGPHAHLPDPSVWPFAVGVAILLIGAGLVWWVRDPDNSLAGPLLGAAVVAALVSIAGWAYEDGKMKRMAEEYGHAAPRNARFTQVITFAVAEGQYTNATSDQGVLHRIEASDSDLRNLAGFQDLRIIASPSETGPSQVLVETTWSDREGLATYDETRQTVLDIVNEFPEQVMRGSVQVFDMVVVRDTKDVAVRFCLGTAATLIGGLAIGGLLIGAGITLFEGEAAPPDVNGPAPPAGFEETGVIVAGNFFFDETEIALPPDTEVTLTLDNREGMHNIQFFDGEDASAPLLTGCTEGCQNGEVATPVETGPVQQTFTFTTPGPGRYFYDCAIHPTDMVGFLTVEEGAPVPGEGAPNGNGNGAPPAQGFEQAGVIGAGNFFFDEDAISLPPETQVTLTLDNREGTHNIQFFDGEDASAPLLGGCVEGCQNGEVATPIGTGPVQQAFTFVTPGPGRYFYDCAIHPTDMVGFLTVEEGAPVPGGAAQGNGEGEEEDGEAEGDATE